MWNVYFGAPCAVFGSNYSPRRISMHWMKPRKSTSEGKNKTQIKIRIGTNNKYLINRSLFMFSNECFALFECIVRWTRFHSWRCHWHNSLRDAYRKRQHNWRTYEGVGDSNADFMSACRSVSLRFNFTVECFFRRCFSLCLHWKQTRVTKPRVPWTI